MESIQLARGTRLSLTLIGIGSLLVGVLVGAVPAGTVAATYWLDAVIVVVAGMVTLARAKRLSAEMVLRWSVGMWAAGVFVVEVFDLGPGGWNPLPALVSAVGGTGYALVALIAIVASDLDSLSRRSDPRQIALRASYVLVGISAGKIIGDHLQWPIETATVLAMIVLTVVLDLNDRSRPKAS